MKTRNPKLVHLGWALILWTLFLFTAATATAAPQNGAPARRIDATLVAGPSAQPAAMIARDDSGRTMLVWVSPALQPHAQSKHRPLPHPSADAVDGARWTRLEAVTPTAL